MTKAISWSGPTQRYRETVRDRLFDRRHTLRVNLQPPIRHGGYFDPETKRFVVFQHSQHRTREARRWRTCLRLARRF